MITIPRRRATLCRSAVLPILAILLVTAPGQAQQPDGAGPPHASELFGGNPADPREVSTYFSVVDWDAPWLETRIAALGVGDRLTLARGHKGRTELRLDADFVIHAQFDLDAPSFDFINADFIASLPLSVRRGPWSGRLRFGHWSAHLGDEFLLRTEPTREETSVEFLEIMAAREFGRVRLLSGALRRLRIVPRTMPRNLVRIAADVTDLAVFDLGRLGRGAAELATDLRWDASTGGPAVSVRAGIEITPRRTEPGYRVWAIELEFFDGPSPFGQYFRQPLRTVGIGFRVR